MKEICVDVRMAVHSGIGTYIRNVVPSLASFFKLRLICHPELVEKWPFLGQSDLILTRSPIYSIQEQITLPFLIPSCDIFWSPHYNSPLAPLKAKKRVVTIHDVYHLAGPVNPLKKLYANLIIKRAVKVADRVVTVSHFSESEIVKYTGISKEKISVVHLGVDPARFTALSDLKMKYELPRHYFLYVGNLAPHKNIDRLLLAWEILSKKFPDWRLVLVGKGSSTSDRALFLGEVPDHDLPALYTQAYAMIHPSLYEGFGLTLLEAMSCDCPVIASNVASIPEVCGDGALYVNPYQVEDIANGMENLIQHPELQENMKTRGRLRSQQFTWEKTVEAHLALLETL